MPINLDRAAIISRDVAAEFDSMLSVASVFSTGGGSGRAEVLVIVNGCHDEPCRHIVNVSRADSEEFEQEFRARLRDALYAHRGA